MNSSKTTRCAPGICHYHRYLYDVHCFYAATGLILLAFGMILFEWYRFQQSAILPIEIVPENTPLVTANWSLFRPRPEEFSYKLLMITTEDGAQIFHSTMIFVLEGVSDKANFAYFVLGNAAACTRMYLRRSFGKLDWTWMIHMSRIATFLTPSVCLSWHALILAPSLCSKRASYIRLSRLFMFKSSLVRQSSVAATILVTLFRKHR